MKSAERFICLYCNQTFEGDMAWEAHRKTYDHAAARMDNDPSISATAFHAPLNQSWANASTVDYIRERSDK
jgi:hypothetical protein